MFPRVGNSRLCSRETGVGNTLSLGLFWPSPWTPTSQGNALPTKQKAEKKLELPADKKESGTRGKMPKRGPPKDHALVGGVNFRAPAAGAARARS